MSWTTTYYHFDGIHSAIELSDAAQALTQPIRYDAFGNIRSGYPQSIAFLFVGQLGYYWDDSSGDYYIRTRTYGSSVARFASQDSLFPAFTLAQYVMVDNAPVSLSDPSGHLAQAELDGKGEYFLFDNKSCCNKQEYGKYAYSTMWVLDKTEVNGFIVQCVRSRINVKRCDGTDLTADDFVSTARSGKTCAPQTEVEKKANYKTYCEVWRVKDGKVYEDAWERKPQKLGATDTFSFAGAKAACRGCIAQAGVAWFLPVDPMNKEADADILQRLKGNGFGYGDAGVASAGGLYSGCVNDTQLAALTRDVLKREGGPQVTEFYTTKLAGVVWDCCKTPCTCGVAKNFDDLFHKPSSVAGDFFKEHDLIEPCSFSVSDLDL